MTGNHLGEFLRARRAAVGPEDVGMASHGVRRVAGLRREEVAVLAGMNADYYTRLEQGRERRPSPQVVDALGRALRLAPSARTHLHHLAGTTPTPRPTADDGREVGPALRQLLDAHTEFPAFVVDGALDVLAANALTRALYAPFERLDNLARMTFLDPAARHVHTHWESTAESVVGHLREAAGPDPENPRLRALVRTLSAHSADFTRLWSTHTVHGKTSAEKHLRHPDVGHLTLTYQSFDVRDAPGRQLIVYQPEPGSPSALRLAALRPPRPAV
ncbi:helix-turn-helix transcriptional regulator [Streptomyces sp. NPDC004539]|uniref:helix-turn-helix transcriptional regulator n=1 Tax=Streptomyces sp. NPDC004539 TaxID=3154280 RepID=UPI0033A0F2D9